MGISATALGRTGVQDWLLQRISAIIIAAYAAFLVGVWCHHYPHLNYEAWHYIFTNMAVKIFSIFFMLSFLVHAWIGLWVIATDYLKNSSVRVTFMVAVILWLFSLFLWGIFILWSY